MSMSKVLTALTLALGVLSILRLEAQGQGAVQVGGPWEGAIQVGASSLRMLVVFTETPAELRAVIDIPQQGASGMPLAAVARTDSNIHFELPTPAARAVFDGRIAGNTISGTFAQGQVSGTFELTRIAPVDNAPRPPYVEHDIAVTNGPVRLAGTLTVPRGAGPFPLVVMITGSGPQNRDEDILGFKIFQVIADRLARQEIAVYRYDDRGVGGSTGNLASVTTPDFAGDALAALAALKSRTEIDAKRIGMLGHSEGATVAAIAASRSADVSFVVLLAPPGARGEDMLRQQALDGARGLGADDAAVARVEAAHRNATSLVVKEASAEEISTAVKDLVRAQYDTLPAAQRQALGDREAFVERTYAQGVAQLQSPWMRFMIDFDHAAPLREVTCPVLALFGRLDLQVPPGLNEPPVRKALAGNRSATIAVLNSANHLFQAAKTGQVSEYATLDKAFVPGFLDQIAAWIGRVASR
jgi:pimeloyl-ACP methyl ester carboxylesterase